jgi:dethiobiotin synthetase
MKGAFVTGTGTGVGKTFVARGVAHSLLRRGKAPIALKPIETGVLTTPQDAVSLARACGRHDLAHDPAFYREALPLAPYAVSLETGRPGPDLGRLAQRVRELSRDAESTWVEGAGGLLVPIDEHATMADFALALALPLLLVTSDRLGVLSHVLTCVESAEQRGLTIACVVLVRHASLDDGTAATNRLILERRLRCPTFAFPNCDDDDAALADAVDASRLLCSFGW